VVKSLHYIIFYIKDDIFMKKQFVYIGSVIILILSIFTFVVFGFGTEVFTAIFGNSNKLPPFGKYDGQKIEYAAGTEFATTAAQIADHYKNMGYELDSDWQQRIFYQAFNQTVMSMAFKKAVEASGYKVPADAINREMLPYFSDQTGKFSAKLYNQTDNATLENMRKEANARLEYSRYADDVLGSSTTVGKTELYGTKVSSKETAFLANMGTEKRSFNLASFDTNNFPKSEAANFAKSKAELFIRYDISAITLDNEKDVNSLLKKIKAKEISFAEAEKEKPLKYYTNKDGALLTPYHYQIATILDNEDDLPTVTGLAKDAMSDVIKTKHGYSIFRANGEPVAADFNDDAMLNVVLTYMKSNEAVYIENYYTKIANDFIANASIDGFDKACEKFAVSKEEVPAFPLNYDDSTLYDSVPSKTVTQLSGASKNPAVLKAAFALKLSEISSPLVLGTNVIVLQLTGIQNDKPAASDSLPGTISSMDKTSLASTLLTSDKVVNNITEVFFKYFRTDSAEQ